MQVHNFTEAKHFYPSILEATVIAWNIFCWLNLYNAVPDMHFFASCEA